MPVDMNKTIQEASLDNLHDIIVPDAVGIFPLAPGWNIVWILLLALLFYFAVQYYEHYKKTLYKREALKELESSRHEILDLLTLARRVALSAYGREEIASLTGDAWWNFMEQNSKAKVSRELRETIEILLYDNEPKNETTHYHTIESIVRVWIKTHKVSDNV